MDLNKVIPKAGSAIVTVKDELRHLLLSGKIPLFEEIGYGYIMGRWICNQSKFRWLFGDNIGEPGMVAVPGRAANRSREGRAGKPYPFMMSTIHWKKVPPS